MMQKISSEQKKKKQNISLQTINLKKRNLGGQNSTEKNGATANCMKKE